MQGIVTDGSGAIIAGAQITVNASGNEATLTTSSDGTGRFALLNLAPGSYQVATEHAGFGKRIQTVTLAAAQALQLSVTLAANSVAQDVTVTAETGSVTEQPVAQTITSVGRQDFKDSPNLDISSAMSLVPGVTTISGNGPRDVFISIRGSNNTSAYGIRNVQIFEDGFPVTQPDGLSRADLTDPHAYDGVDVVQGPSSTLYGNYATGGAIFFRTRPGASINGLEFGTDAGSFGYLNNYVTAGGAGDRYQYSAFVSNVRARQFTENNAYDTITANLFGQFSLTPRDRVAVKFIDNDLDTELSIRLSLNQYQTNPYQHGCAVYNAATVNGCGSVSLYANGFTGTKESLTASQVGLGRHDRRTIFGARWEHDITKNTTWRTQFVWDDKDINQPTGTSSARGSSPSFNLFSDGTRKGLLFGRPSVTYGGGFFDYENLNSLSYNLAPGGKATLGGLTQTTYGYVLDAGFRGREQFSFNRKWTAVAGFAGQYTKLSAIDTIYSYSATGTPTTRLIQANRPYFNISPEAALLYSPTDNLQLHARLGTGFGTPQASNLFITPQGVYGNNSQLNAQKNVGIDVGADWSLSNAFQLTVAGFYEHFTDELVTQSAGANLQSYTYNAPSSAHRGMVAGFNWRLLPTTVHGLRLLTSYTLDEQIYKRYTETLSAGTFSTSFNRNGESMPGVIPNNLTARLVEDQATRRFGSFGGFIETTYREAYSLDNANLIKAPSVTLMNLDFHYDPAPEHGKWSRLHFYFDVQNLANRTYVGSAINITDSISSTTGLENGTSTLANSTGSIYAGMPRASYGGVRFKF